MDKFLHIFLQGQNILQHHPPARDWLEAEMDESGTDLKAFHGEGEQAQLVQEHFLVVESQLRSVRLRSNSPLNIPAVS